MLCTAPDVVVMKMHDCVIGSRTVLRTMVSAGVLAVLVLAGAGATTRVVDGDGDADLVSIRAAADVATSGDSIEVWGRSYV